MRRLRIIGFALAILGLAAMSQADYKKTFIEGCTARDQRNWQQTAVKMREAVSENGTEGGRVRGAGMFTEAYYPHYYLGLAYFNSGNYKAAADEFAESERQGAIKADGALYANLRKMQQSIGAAPASTPPPPPVQEAQKEPKKEEKKADDKKPADGAKSGADPAVIARAVEQARSEIARSQELQISILGQKDSQPFAPVWQHDPKLQESYSLVLQKLNKAKAALQSGIAKGEVTEIDTATETASSAQADLVKLQSAMADSKTAYDKAQLAAKVPQDKTAEKVAAADLLRKKRDNDERRLKEKADFDRQEVARQLQRRVSSANTVLGMLEKAGPDPGVARSKGEIKSLVQRFSILGSGGAIADLRMLGDRLSEALSGANELLSRAAAASGGPPPTLVDAAASFFNGDYQRTVSVLEKASFTEPRATTHALLLRAAARYALFMVGGGTDEKMRALAAEDAGACHRRDPKLMPQRSVFSPGFADFFRKNG